MDARTLATVHAVGRVVLGGGLVAAPSLVAGAWVGAPADAPGGRALAIGLGGRDLAIATGMLVALARGRGERDWVRAAVVADLADVVATLRNRDDLAPLAVPAVLALAGGSVVLGLYLQHALG